MSPLLANYFKLIKRLIPVDRQASVVGLDIGPGVCKAVELTQGADGFELLRWMTEPVENQDEKAAVSKIVTAWELNAKPRPVISAVAGRGTLIRYIDMPRMPLKDLKRSFSIESDKYFPFPKDTVYTDCFILDPQGGDKRMSVLIAAVKKELIDARLKIFKDAGLDVCAITLNSIAVCNAARAFSLDAPVAVSGQPDRAVAVIDIGDAVTNLMVTMGKVPRFNRDIFLGTQEVYKRFGNVTGVSAAEARKILGGSGEKRVEGAQEVDAVMANLVAEIRLSFEYFITEKNLQIGQILLLGEGVLLPGVETIFRESFDVPVQVYNPFQKISLANGVDKNEISRQGVRMVTALGLALNEYD